MDNDDIVTPKYKMIFLGDQSVGKSCILNRYVNDTFTEEYQATIGLDFLSKNITINETDVRMLLYDTYIYKLKYIVQVKKSSEV